MTAIISPARPQTGALRIVGNSDGETLAPWAAQPQEVIAALGTSQSGLTSTDAASRLREYGPNRLETAARKPWYVKLWHHASDILILMLIGAAILKAIMGDWIDFSVILAVIVINIAIGLIQEGKAEAALDAIKGMLSSTATTLRDGAWVEVDAETLVPGDIIRVRPGDRVPADARLIESTNLQVEESALTGESVASVKSAASVSPDANVGDRTSMLFSSTLVVAGTGLAVVTATGSRTEIGHIQEMIAEAEHIDTPLTKAMAAFGRKLAILVLVLAAVMVLIGLFLHNRTGGDLISTTIGFAVAAIPEGLPAMVTITLALGVQAMARRNAISRHMTSVETIGSVSTICSDKTGTLTQNEMTVREVITRHGTYLVTGNGYSPEGEIEYYGDHSQAGQTRDIRALGKVMELCNDAQLTREAETPGGSGGRWKLVGEPTEGAVYVFGRKSGVDTTGWKRVAEIPFDSATKYMATISEDPDGDRWIMVKGALDSVARRCTTQLAADGRTLEPFDADFWNAQMDFLASQGLRVLAGAHHDIEDHIDSFDSDGPTGMTMVGIVGIVDPPRPEAIAAIAEARNAGIAVTMITGDHVGTAKAIASEMGITDSTDAPTLTGAQLEAMSDTELRNVVRDVHVYARTSPEHKIRIVRALQSHGEVVAMTGDGVNDAPALTQADVGVAMGIKGTEATKEAADIVLADDNFATIERAVAEGRRIYDNIRKAILFMLPTNGAQALVLLTATLLGWALLPLAPVQVLWVNMVTSVTLSLPLATEIAEPDVMNRPPRDPKTPLLTRDFLIRVLLVSLLIGGATMLMFWLGMNRFGMALPQAQGLAVTMLTLGQIAYLFNCRFLGRSSLTPRVFQGNRTIWYAIGALLGLTMLFLYVPFMQNIFRVAPIGLTEWMWCLALAALIFLLVEGLKLIDRWRINRARY